MNDQRARCRPGTAGVGDAGVWSTPGAVVVMDAEQIRTDRPRWLAERRKGIGGSDVAALMGEAKYGGTEYSVWLDKTGREADLESSEAMQWGNDLEDAIAQRFAVRNGFTVITSGLLRSRTHPHALASADRLVSDGGGLEVKNHGPWLRRQYADGAFPRAFYWQCVAGMAVTGRSHWYLAALIGGNHLEVRRMNRADCRADIGLVLERCESWWDYVTSDIAPLTGAPPDWEELKADTIEASMPELVADDAARWRQILAAEKEMEAEKKDIQARMLSELGGHRALSVNGVPVVRLVEKKGSSRFLRAQLRKDLPEIEAKYSGTGPPSRYPQLVREPTA